MSRISTAGSCPWGTPNPGTSSTGLEATNALAFGDLNGDGRPDAVAAGQTPQAIAVLLADGRGGFVPPVAYSISSPALFVVLGDFDGNGTVDVAIASADSIALFSGNGDGTLDSPVSSPSGGDTAAIAGLPVNGGKSILVQLLRAGSIRLLIPDETFHLSAGAEHGLSGQILPAPVPSVQPIELEHDRRSSVLALLDGTVLVLDPQADNSLELVSSTYVSGTAITVDDFDRDGREDFATVDSPFFQVWFGDGSGGFSLRQTLANPNPSQGHAIFHGDADGDGFADLLVAQDSLLLVFPGSRGGGFGVPRQYACPNGGGFIVSSNFSPAAPEILFGQVAWGIVELSLSEEREWRPETRFSGDPFHFVAGDFDGDGAVDLLYPNPSASVLRHGYGDGSFAPAAPGPIPSPFEIAQPPSSDPVLLDFNGDGIKDVGYYGSGQFVWCPRSADGSFDPPVVTDLGLADGGDAIVGDIDGDGIPDLAVSFGNRLLTFRGDPSGHLHQIISIPVTMTGGLFSAGDFDGDGRLDFVADEGLTVPLGAERAPAISVFYGKPDGSLEERELVQVAGGFRRGFPAGAVGDFNGDGIADLALSLLPGAIGVQHYTGGLQIFPGSRDRTWTGSVQNILFVPIIEAVDIDQDGHVDLFGSQYQVFSVLRGNGDGTFDEPTKFLAPNSGSVAPLVDLDGDEVPEIRQLSSFVGLEITRIPSAIDIEPSRLPTFWVGRPLEFPLSVDESGSVSFSVVGGRLPDGIKLSTGGVLSGTATTTGEFHFALQVRDEEGCTGRRSYRAVVSTFQRPRVKIVRPSAAASVREPRE